MAVDREGTPTNPGDLVEIYGKSRTGKRVVAVADSGIYIQWNQHDARSIRYLADSDRCYTTLGPEL